MAENDSPQPERIGGHEIIGRLGEGPRGVVHLGRESADAPQVVVKTLTIDLAADPGFAERLREVTRVSSSYVARTIAAGVEDGRPYVIREHVEGRSLAEAVAADGPLSGDALDRVAVGMLTALTAVHVAGFAHRGLTPSNVILTADGPRITDMELGEPAGELGYRAPEQLGGLQYGPYADVFSWAATVVFAATGAAPFEHDEQSVLHGEPAIGELPEPLRQVVVAALAKDVTGRPTAYVALLRLLGDANAPIPAQAVQGVPVPPPGSGDAAITLLDGVAVPPQAGPPGAGPVPPPGGQPPLILPIQLAIEGAQVPQLPDGPMQPHGPGPAHPHGPMAQPPMGGAPMGGAPMPPGPAWGPPPMGDGPAPHGIPPVPMGHDGVPPQQGAIVPSPMGPGHHEAPMWGPPPMADQHQPQHPPHLLHRQGDNQPRKPFPIGLVAGVTAVVLLSGLGLWGASQYSDRVTFEPVAAASGSPSPGNAAAQGQGTAPATQPQTEVTAPWAATTPSPDDNGVGPMVLPTEGPTDSADVPVLTTVPTPPPAVTQQPVPVPTVTAQPTQAKATPTAKPSKTAKAKPTATVTKTVPPSKKATPTPAKTTKEPTREPEPTPTKTTAKPTPTKTTAKPTPTKTTAKPTPTKTTSPPKTNPYSATQVCGSGFSVQRSSSFSGGTTYQLWNNSTGQNCVVTLKSGANVGKSTPVSATLEVQGGGSQTDSGSYEYYAGPVKLPAKGKCVRYSGSAGSGSTSAAWGNCG
ncbi:protein kinase [Nonomuraea sp. PA05]|uniref:serine/threonine protein kinase n=1 Tax=Nonomuraea sp. PA05 TaxID=2604466 RepID=UPI0011DB9EEB|nr:serine/threonine-protein kinase [Nonomuraea sp. PA05]TYB59797.1 protein kinase [Nonomuraea sp. PA05]